MSAPAQKAVPHTRAKAYRLRLYNTQLPLHSPAESSRKALTTKPSLKTTPLAEAHSASVCICVYCNASVFKIKLNVFLDS